MEGVVCRASSSYRTSGLDRRWHPWLGVGADTVVPDWPEVTGLVADKGLLVLVDEAVIVHVS